MTQEQHNMEQARYEEMVEEAIGIKRRTRRDQVRLMLLIFEAQEGHVLEKFCQDINLSLAAAGNYLAAHTKAIEMGVIPGSGSGADEAIQEMWDMIFDPTLDGRYGYGGVDREGVDAAVAGMGLRGPTKAYDIAKNPNSMKAAIIGDSRAASAAVEALITRAQDDESIAIALRSMLRTSPSPRPMPHREVDAVRNLLHRLDQASLDLIQVDVPDYMASLVAQHVGTVINRLHEVITIMNGKEALKTI